MKCEICRENEGFSDGCSYLLICDDCIRENKKIMNDNNNYEYYEDVTIKELASMAAKNGDNVTISITNQEKLAKLYRGLGEKISKYKITIRQDREV